MALALDIWTAIALASFRSSDMLLMLKLLALLTDSEKPYFGLFQKVTLYSLAAMGYFFLAARRANRALSS